jgi:hypothetical protein
MSDQNQTKHRRGEQRTMRTLYPAFALLLGSTVSVGLAQTTAPTVPPGTGARPGNEIGTGSSLPRSNNASNITKSDTRSDIAPNLPSPPIGENASVHDYLVAARTSLTAGRTGEAQQAMEMAETRALDRSVPRSPTTAPIKDPVVSGITRCPERPGLGRPGAQPEHSRQPDRT